MLKTHYPSTLSTYRDALTGRTVTRLVNLPARCMNFYFTENSFIKGQNALLFVSELDTPGVENIFRLDLPGGEVTRVTGYAAPHHLKGHTKTPDGALACYNVDRDVCVLDTKTGEERRVFVIPEGFRSARISLNCDRTLLAVQYNEEVGCGMGDNYRNFIFRMNAIKRCEIAVVDLRTGDARVVVRDTAEGGHLQFSPTNPYLFMFCHEGPWHMVSQRIYLCDARTGALAPCFRQAPEDSVGHEFFTQDGLVFFDNRGPGHDGTITVSREQAIVKDAPKSGFIPYVGLADEAGHVVRKYLLPHYCNHYHCDQTNLLLVGDEVENLVLIDCAGDAPRISPLCAHHTSWNGQHTHCHPTFSWDGKRVLFVSDASGVSQLYMVEV